ncbi:ES1 protein homolog, mitochondrial-like [Schistocerca americana]|nr:ES1 protein homolog, mitochondrial-like [Schistocerca americana]XP_046997510.1 ES1 protein homolog, mitochondrial-like [Schistocerca americana]XP_047115193.1 ES1 protein homolog, mitochondrial-like isoform X2 [Schistocerca piceifrons]XP_047115194.1 ES1 protein homolog, mitochondrial-like isoform X2 [Schistocerca piceifrons]
MLRFIVPNVNKLVFQQYGCTAAFSSAASSKTIAVVLSGCGVYDGSEIHEATAVLAHITRKGAEPIVYAPDVKQMHVIDHQKGSPVDGENRSVLSESARIARGPVKPLSELTVDSASAVVFPGGFGAAKNLCDFAVKGADCSVNPDVARVLQDFHKAKKPIALCCIAPVLAAKVLKGVTVTLGKQDDGKGSWPHAGAIDAAKAMGANIEFKNVTDACVDEKNLIVTTPAFMYNGKFHEIHDGIGVMIQKLLSLIKK